MPCRSLCRLYIHLAFTYTLRWSLKRSMKERTWTGSFAFFHQWECLKCSGHGLSVSCVKWPLVPKLVVMDFVNLFVKNTWILFKRFPLSSRTCEPLWMPLMPRSHQTLRLVLAVKLLGIMLRNRWRSTTFLTITAGDANGWCRNYPVWTAP